MPNKKTIETGISDFKGFIENDYYFVDKTELIYDFFTHGSYISLIPRPKRFGKTLNLSMIEHFFDIQKPESATLFEGLKISEKKDFCKTHQNRYPVINISLKDIKENSWGKCLHSFQDLMSELYEKFDFLLNSDKLKSFHKKRIEDIILKKANEIEYKTSLQKLSKYLIEHFGEKVIILVDEYDTPIISAYKNTPKPIKRPKGETSYYENVISFMQTFLGKAYKGNKNLRKGLITGVMRVARESIFSDWNNFNVYGITSNYFSDSFGFTQHETGQILSYFGMEDTFEDVKKWYDGYKFGEISSIYNPWSIVNFILNKKDGFQSYWVNTSDYSLIKERITKENVIAKLKTLIEGKIIDEPLFENFVFTDFETEHELLWTLLAYNGYLTQIEKSNYGNYKLKIPNQEIKKVYSDIIMTWLKMQVKLKRDLLISTTDSLVNNRLKEFETGFKQIIGDTLSYFDSGESADITREQIYHVYTLGLLAILSDEYIIKSNRESGEGRYDILLIPFDKSKNGIVIEIKSIEKQTKNETKNDFAQRIDKEINKDLQQIEEKQYYKELLSHKIPRENIIKVPVVFAGKEPYIIK